MKQCLQSQTGVLGRREIMMFVKYICSSCLKPSSDISVIAELSKIQNNMMLPATEYTKIPFNYQSSLTINLSHSQ